MPDDNADPATEASPAVLYELDGNIATITINRPEARNAVNGSVAQGIEAALDDFEANPNAWVAILTGAGTSFCAGADLKEIAAGNARAISTKRGGFAGYVVRERTKPVIAAVNGHAVAGGCEIMLASDLAVVSEGVMIGVPEVKRSLAAAAGAMWRLPRAAGSARAAEMLLTGDPITPEDALSFGLINAVVPADQVMSAARALADRIAVNAPLAVQQTLGVLRRAYDDDAAELYAASGRAMSALSRTEDYAEGPRAFIEKRPAVWKGR